MDNMDSILTSIKQMLGIEEAQEEFDVEIITHINSVFDDLAQLGVGPAEGFCIEDETSVWTDFIPDLTKLQSVKSYMFLRVKLLFDSTSIGASMLASYERQIEKWEWRLNVAAESE